MFCEFQFFPKMTHHGKPKTEMKIQNSDLKNEFHSQTENLSVFQNSGDESFE